MGALGDLLYRAASLWDNLAGNITTTRKFLRQTGTGAVSAAPAWDTLQAGDLPNTAVTPGSYTNTNLTVDQQGRLTAAANGSPGTGTVTHTGNLNANNLVVGNAVADIKTVAAIDGQIPIGKTSDGSVTLASLTAGANITITPGAASVTIAATAGAGGTGNSIYTGAEGSEPGGINAGDLYLPNNGIYVRRYSGSIWTPCGPLFPCVEPSAGSYTQVNFQGSDAVTSANGGFYLNVPFGGSNWRLMVKNIIASHYTLTVGLLPFQAADGNTAFGLILYDGTKLMSFHCGYNQTVIQQWNSVSSFNSTVHSDPTILYYLNAGPLVWLQIQDDGTHRTYRISVNGQNWVQFYQQATGSWLTETQYGIGVFNSSGSTTNGVHAVSVGEV